MSLVIWIVIVLLLLGLIGFKGYPWVRNYMQRRRERMEIEERYKKLLKTRDDIEYHYHWAKDRGDEKEANNMWKELDLVEAEMIKLSSIYDGYQNTKKNN